MIYVVVTYRIHIKCLNYLNLYLSVFKSSVGKIKQTYSYLCRDFAFKLRQSLYMCFLNFPSRWQSGIRSPCLRRKSSKMKRKGAEEGRKETRLNVIHCVSAEKTQWYITFTTILCSKNTRLE